MIIREMTAFQDLKDRGFLEVLESLRPVGLVTEDEYGGVFRRIITNPMITIFVAEDETSRQIVGTITLLTEQKFIHKGGIVGRIEDVAVKKGWESRGVATALIQKAIERARASGCYKILLTCNEDMISFYRKMGFRQHEIAMRLDLLDPTLE